MCKIENGTRFRTDIRWIMFSEIIFQTDLQNFFLLESPTSCNRKVFYECVIGYLGFSKQACLKSRTT